VCRSEDVGTREVATDTLKELLETIGQEARPFITDIYEICMGVCVCVRVHIVLCMVVCIPTSPRIHMQLSASGL
jgi:hypothetical protein